MANHGQHPQEASASNRSGGGQAVVDLCEVTSSGLVFWSRQRFDIGSELQIRLHRDALPAHMASAEEWVTVRGFVIECPPVRRENGTPAFRVSLLLDSALMQPVKQQPMSLPCQRTRLAGLARMGLN